MDELLDKIRNGDRRALARAMSAMDAGGRDADAMKDRLRTLTGQTPWWGVTGPPGVGKSTLIDRLLIELRSRGRRVGVVAVDPTSPASNGALLGDRVRMMNHAVDRDVFIRSLATHHAEGGLSDAALHCARLLEWAGFDTILIETVGVGQNEFDIADVADICAAVLGPGYGDDIQLSKAGLIEIADILVVNKCDQPEADRLQSQLRQELDLAENGAPIEIFATEAKSGRGVERLLERFLELDQAARRGETRRRRTLNEIRHDARRRCERALTRRLNEPAAAQLADKLEHGELTMRDAVARLTADLDI